MALTQSHFRFGINESTEALHGWHAAEDTSLGAWTLVDTTFLLRFTVQCDTTAANNLALQFQYNENNTGWVDITTTSNVVRAVTSAVATNGANTTKRLSGTGTFETSSAGFTHDGSSGGAAMDIVASGNAETECAIQVRSVDVVNGDVIQFRLVEVGGALLSSYPVTPSLTMSLPIVFGATRPFIPRAMKVMRANVAALANLFRNVTDTTSPPPPPPEIPGDATAHLVIPWMTRIAPRAAILAALTFTSPSPIPAAATLDGSAVLALTASGDLTTSIPLTGSADLALSATAELTPGAGAPALGDSTSHLVIGWSPSHAPRAAISAALAFASPELGIPPPVEPPGPTSIARAWKPATAIKAATQALYRNLIVSIEDEPYGDASGVSVIAWRNAPRPERLRAATQALYRSGWGAPPIAVDAALDGSAVLALGATADLTTAIPLDGASTLALSATADVLTAIALDGAAALILGATADLTTSTPLDGSAVLALDAAGTLTTAIPLDGSAALILGAAADLTTATPLDGSAVLALDATAILTTAIALDGSAALVLDATSTLTTAIPLAGTADLVLTVAGDLVGVAVALDGTATLALTTAGDLITAIPLTGTADLALISTASLTTAIPLTGSAVLELTVAGTLFHPIVQFLDVEFTLGEMAVIFTATAINPTFTTEEIQPEWIASAIGPTFIAQDLNIGFTATEG
jgi:hypothetical protein